MRARANVYHLECFACQQCGHRFCVGDHFYLHDNQVHSISYDGLVLTNSQIQRSLWQVLCGPDYEERMVFASLSSHPTQLAQLRHGSGGTQLQHHQHQPSLNQNGPSTLPPVSCLASSSPAVRQRTPLPPISSVRSSLLQT